MDLASWTAIAAGVRDLAISGTVGGLVSAAVVMPGGAARSAAMRLARWSSVAWVAAAVAHPILSYALIDPGAPARPGFGNELWWFLTTISLGQVLLQVAIAGVLTSLAAAAAETRTQIAWTLAPVAWALIVIALTGHASGATDHHLGTSAMFLHYAGAGLWVGVIAALIIARSALGEGAADAVARTSRIAAWAVVLIVASGAVNALLRLDDVSDLWTTLYGALLAAKVALVVVALAFGAWYRSRVIPAIRSGVRAAFWKVLGVELSVLGLATGLAAALSAMAPPVPPEPIADPSPAWYLTGYDLPPESTLVHWVTEWRFEMITALAIGAAAWVYASWVIRLRRRGDAWPWYRTALWFFGLAILAYATQGPPAVYGMVTFSGHMIEHMIFVSVAPVPLVLAAPVTLALRALPGRDDGSRGPREWLRAFIESWPLRLLANPVIAAVNFAGSMFVFYYTPIFDWVLRNHVGHVWMALHFVAAGYFFVNALAGVDPGPKRPAYPMRLVLLFMTMGFHAFFGVALMMSEALLAPRWFGLTGRDWGPDAITDQQLGGQIAWGFGEIPVILLAIAVAVAWRRADEQVARRQDRAAERDDDAELREYNEMLRRMEQRDRA